jgi:DNA excision repair protein ERCC-2
MLACAPYPLQEAVPGNIRKAEHFVTFLKKLVEFFKRRLRGSSVEKEFPEGFMHDLYVKTALEKKALKFTYSRLNSLLRTLEISSLEEFTPLQEVANFATLVSTYTAGFSVITEPLGSVIAGVQEPLLQLCCLDASLAIAPVFKRFSSVIITSGTLSPIELYPKLLNFYPVVRASLPMSTFRPCLLPLVVTRGSDQIPLSTKFDQRKDPSVVRNYGDLLLQVVRTVPDGVCCFFTSYSFMEDIISQWDQLRILQKVGWVSVVCHDVVIISLSA